MFFIIVYYAECLALSLLPPFFSHGPTRHLKKILKIIYTTRTKLSQLHSHFFYTELEILKICPTLRLYCA